MISVRLAAALRLSLPGLAVLLILAALRHLLWWEALAGWLAIVAGSSLLIRHHLIALDRLRSFTDRLAGDLDRGIPSALLRAAPSVRDVASAVVRLDKAHRERTQEALRLADMRGGVLDSVPDPLATLDDQLRIVWANQPARALLGQTIVGREISTVLRDPSVLQAVKAALSSKVDAVRALELVLSDPIERDFMFGVQRLAHRAPDGTCAVLILHDVTALRRAERMRADFIANASHELRTPLASLVGFIETLQGPAREDAQARERFLVIMHEQAQRMARLVEDLLSLSRIEQREYQTPTDLVDLVSLVQKAIAGLELHARQRGMSLILTTSLAGLAVRGAADDLTQLIQNLIDNAIKYGKSGAPVEISLAPAPSPPSLPKSAHGAVALSVRDHGEGIAREHLPRLTERFYRIDKARSRAIGGTGLGLAICKHIVNRHRGALTIDSEVGHGTNFTVFLPLPAPNGGSKDAQ